MPLGSRTMVAALSAALALSLSGCGVTELLSPSDDQLLKAVSLRAKDAAPDATFAPHEDGDVVAGQDSLDLCFGTFPSERLRIGRLQVGIAANADSDDEVSSEAILYSTPAEAEQAMGELTAAREECPEQAKPMPDQPSVSVEWTFGAPPDTDWPQRAGVRRQAYAFTVSVQDSDLSSAGTAVYLQRGRMILALYSTPPTIPQQVIVNSPDPQRFTDVMTQRLLQLPEDALQQGDPDNRVQDPRDFGT